MKLGEKVLLPVGDGKVTLPVGTIPPVGEPNGYGERPAPVKLG